MGRRLAILLALTILVASGLVHGSWADRWQPSDLLLEAADRVGRVPLEIGDWKGQDSAVDAAAFAQAGAQKYWTRNYVHNTSKVTLVVILMCGRSGRMAVHTPEVCYRGAGYKMDGEPAIWTVPAKPGSESGSFWTARFSKGLGSDLRLYWAWGSRGAWQAPSNPRWQFGGEPFLYKLYVSHDAHGGGAAPAAQDFLRQLLGEMHKTLWDPSP